MVNAMKVFYLRFRENLLVSYLIFVVALVFEFLAPPALDQILTTPGHLSKVSRDNIQN